MGSVYELWSIGYQLLGFSGYFDYYDALGFEFVFRVARCPTHPQ